MSKKSQYITNQSQLDTIDRLKKEHEISKITIGPANTVENQLRMYAYENSFLVKTVGICALDKIGNRYTLEHGINSALKELETYLKKMNRISALKSEYPKEVF